MCFKLKRGRDFEGFASTNFLFSAFSIYNNRLKTYSSNSKFLSSVSPLQCIIFYLYVHKLKHYYTYYTTIHTTTKQQRNIKTKYKKKKKTKTKHFAWLEQISFAGNSERRSSDKSDQLTNSSYNIENNKNQKSIHLTNNNNSATTPGLCKLQQN